MTSALEKLLATDVLENLEGKATAELFNAFNFVEKDGVVSFEESESRLKKLVKDVQRTLASKEAASALVLASANAALCAKVLSTLIAEATAAEGDVAPRQSTLFNILQVEADSEALSALLIEALRAQALGGEKSAAAPHLFSALIASQALLEQLGALICSTEMQEPSQVLPAGSDPLLRSLSAASRVNRALADNAALSLAAVESSMQRLGVS